MVWPTDVPAGGDVAAVIKIIAPDLPNDERTISVLSDEFRPDIVRLQDNPVLVQHADMRGERVQDSAGEGVAGPQCFLRNFPLGDVRCNAANRVRRAVESPQRKLGHKTRVGTVIVECNLLELERPLGFHYLEVVGSKCRGLLRREEIMIRLADDVLADEMEGPLELLIDVQIAALQILEEDQARAVIQRWIEAGLRFRARRVQQTCDRSRPEAPSASG